MGTPTRGHGLLEGVLARWRANVADKRIPDSLRQGRILDIGCGTRPDFLLNIRFAEKTGVDRCASGVSDTFLTAARIRRVHHDIGAQERLPFDNEHFEAVTLLSVIEHLEPAIVPGLVREVRRVLRPGGVFICITPTPFSDCVLRAFARFRLVSPEEINEHKAYYNCAQLKALLADAGLTEVKTGRFELRLNQWVAGLKPLHSQQCFL